MYGEEGQRGRLAEGIDLYGKVETLEYL